MNGTAANSEKFLQTICDKNQSNYSKSVSDSETKTWTTITANLADQKKTFSEQYLYKLIWVERNHNWCNIISSVSMMKVKLKGLIMQCKSIRPNISYVQLATFLCCLFESIGK